MGGCLFFKEQRTKRDVWIQRGKNEQRGSSSRGQRDSGANGLGRREPRRSHRNNKRFVLTDSRSCEWLEKKNYIFPLREDGGKKKEPLSVRR